MESNQIVLSDCLDYIRSVPSDSIQVAFCDPPFNLAKDYGTTSDDNREEEEYLDWCQQWLAEVVRVTHPTGSIFVHHIPRFLIYFARMLDCLGVIFKNWIAWDAPSGPMGKLLQPAHYGFLYYGKSAETKFYQIRHAHRYCIRCKRLAKDWGGKKHTIPPFGPLTSDCWTDIHRIKHGQHEAMNHPCILPVHLLERLLLFSSDTGDIVLDPFTGTGTTAVAAKRLGRQFLGCELNPEYHALANRRVAEEDFVSKVGNSWVSMFPTKEVVTKVLTIRHDDWPDLEQHFDVPEDHSELDHCRLKLKKRRRKSKKSLE